MIDHQRLHVVDDLGELDPAWAGIRQSFHDVAGARVRVLAAGEPDGRPPLVLVHGLGGAATNWVEVQPALAVDRHVVAVDLPGHGETEPHRPNAPRPAAAARFLGRVLRQLDLAPAVLVGNSMGGMVATLVAGESPELAAGLVLVAPALPQANGRPRTSRGAVVQFAPFVVPQLGAAVRRRRARRLTPAQRQQMKLDLIVADPDVLPPRVNELGIANVTRGDELAWRQAAFGSAVQGLFDLTVRGGRTRALAAVDAVRCPTLLLRGDRDQLVHANVVATVRRLRPDWDVVELPGVGHVPQLEVPGRFVELVRDHLVAVDHRSATVAGDG